MQETAAAPQPLGELRAGNLEVRLADSTADIEAAQRLRYAVFYEEMQARPTVDMRTARRDFDAFDDLCDHLLVIDHDQKGSDAVVGTYRLIVVKPPSAAANSIHRANTTSRRSWNIRAAFSNSAAPASRPTIAAVRP